MGGGVGKEGVNSSRVRAASSTSRREADEVRVRTQEMVGEFSRVPVEAITERSGLHSYLVPSSH